MFDFSKFVEAYLTEIKVNQADQMVTLSLREATGKNWSLTATNVSDLMVLQMCMQNIVDRISIWNSSSDEVDYRDKIFSLIHGKFIKENNDLPSPLIKQRIESIRRGELILIELEPVYGALVLILAEAIVLSEQSENTRMR